MSSLLIPKEQQTAYERWEMSSFADDTRDTPQAKVKKSAPISSDDNALGRYLAKARQDGFEQGKKEGLQIGLNEAKASIAEQSQMLVQMAHSFSESVKKSNDEISESLLNLALDIAKAMLKSRMQVNDDVILPVIRDAISQLPYVIQPAVLILNPADMSIVMQEMSGEIALGGWQLREDQVIEQGGCMIETGANQIDATNGTRWRRVCDALGKPDVWQHK